jgi:hypothetical protein
MERGEQACQRDAMSWAGAGATTSRKLDSSRDACDDSIQAGSGCSAQDGTRVAGLAAAPAPETPGAASTPDARRHASCWRRSTIDADGNRVSRAVAAGTVSGLHRWRCPPCRAHSIE